MVFDSAKERKKKKNCQLRSYNVYTFMPDAEVTRHRVTAREAASHFLPFLYTANKKKDIRKRSLDGQIYMCCCIPHKACAATHISSEKSNVQRILDFYVHTSQRRTHQILLIRKFCNIVLPRRTLIFFFFFVFSI